MHSIGARFFLSLGNVFFSLILGAVALGFFWFYFPDWTLQLFRWAGSIRESLISGNWPARYEVVLRALVDERQIVYMGFVLATRIIVGIVIALVLQAVRRPGRRGISDLAALPGARIVNPILMVASLAWSRCAGDAVRARDALGHGGQRRWGSSVRPGPARWRGKRRPNRAC